MPAAGTSDSAWLSVAEVRLPHRWNRRQRSIIVHSSPLPSSGRHPRRTSLAVQSLLRTREAVRDLQKQRAEVELEAAIAKTAFEKRALELQELTFQRQKELHELTHQHKKELLQHQKELHELTIQQKKELHELAMKQQKCALEKQLLELEKLKKELLQ